MADEEQTCFLDDLPEEILLKIFTKLSQSDLLLSARPVCKKWLRLSKDESLWTSVDLSVLFLGCDHMNRSNNARGVEMLLCDIQDCVEKISFSNVPLEGETYELYCCAQKYSQNNVCFQKLRCLDYSYSFVNLYQLRRALCTYSSLTELILIHTNIILSNVITEALHLPHLKKLIFHDIHAWENFLEHPSDFSRSTNSRALTKLPQHCPCLEWVEFYTMWAEFDDNVIQQFIRHCSSLKKLYFTWSSNLTEAAFRNATRTNSVTHLGFADRHGQGAFLSFIFPHFPQLLSLTVDGYQVYEEDCIAISQNCPNLQELVFDVKDLRDPMNVFFWGLHQFNTFLCTPKLQEIAQHCRHLRTLHAPCSKVDDNGFFFLVKHCPHLEDINFMCCGNLTVKCLHALSQHSPHMKCVNFQYTLTSHDYVHALLSNCLRLHEVILDGKFSSGAQSSHPFSPMTPSDSRSPQNEVALHASLHSGDTKSYDEIEEIPFIDLPNNHVCEEHTTITTDFDDSTSTSTSSDSLVTYPNPQTLPLEDSNLTWTIHDDSVYFPVLANHCHVSILSLKNTDISSATLQQIFQLCPDLTHVDLDGCSGLTDETIHSLAVHCQNIKVLMMSSKEEGPHHISDYSLRKLSRFSRNLETVSVLNSHNISHKGICNILDSLDSTLKHLRSLSFCVGANLRCKMPLPEIHWLRYLSKRSAISLEEATSSRESSHFRILHLEFLQRRV